MKVCDGIFNLREGVFTKEKDNICNLPTIATIELHKSNETGHYYINFIEWMSGCNEGLWHDQEISEEVAKIMLSFCYPEHVCECCSAKRWKEVKHE